MSEERKQRLVWIDATRALCVFGIVLMHFLIWVYAPTAERFPDDTGIWSSVSEVLLPFRMPLLFAISGLLVSGRVREGWGDKRNALRAASSYYLYVIWLSVYAILSLAIWQPLPLRITSPGHYLQQLLLPETPLWFVFFLAVNVVVLTTPGF